MSIALEVRGLVKRHSVGIGACLASAEVLRGIDLTVRAGEAVAIVGDRGCGKSTLLLCMAALLSPDAGELRWFGDSSRSAGVRRVLYHVAHTDLLRGGSGPQPNIHLLDIDHGAEAAGLGRWIANRCDAGDAVIVTSRDDDWIDAFGPRAPRVLRMRFGRLHDADPHPRIRVAEPMRQ